MKKLTTALFLAITSSLTFGQSAPLQKVLVENFTSAGCGFCSDGILKLHDIAEQNSNVIPITIHWQDDQHVDAMMVDDGRDVFTGFYITGFPSAAINRVNFSTGGLQIGRGKWDNKVNELLDGAPTAPVDVKINKVYDENSRQLTVTLTMEFFEDVSGDIRPNCYIIEDSVYDGSPTYNGYSQLNYYYNDPDHRLYQKGIWYSNYNGGASYMTDWYHRGYYVTCLEAPGSASILPTTVKAGEIYTYEYTTTLPAEYDIDQITLIGLVQEYNASITERQILQAESKLEDIGAVSVYNIQSPLESATLYPNPISNSSVVTIAVNSDRSLNITLYDINGKMINSSFEDFFTKGKHTIALSSLVNMDLLEKGYYMLMFNDGVNAEQLNFIKH